MTPLKPAEGSATASRATILDHGPTEPHGHFGARIGAWLASDPQRLLHRVSLVLLVLWCVGWGVSLVRHELVGVRKGWFGGCFGVDFLCHVDQPTRAWLAGGDAYEDKSDRICPYPPMTMRLFAWVGLMTPHQALAVWICALGVLAATGAVASWKCRRRLELDAIPLSSVLVAMLYSTPLIFAMERGQYDLLTAPIIMLALVFMRRESRLSQILAGAVLAVSPWLKVYPGLLGIGLAGLKRWDALASFAIVGLAIGVSMPDDTERWLVNNELHLEMTKTRSRAEPPTRVHPWGHSLSENWPRIWNNTPLSFLSRIDGYVATAAILTPMLLCVSWRMYGCQKRELLAFPYLLWIVATAAFVPPVANDYSLVFLPLAALAVCGRRDPLPCRMAILALIVWWQPVQLPISGRVLILLKLAAVASVGISLMRRASELNAAVLHSGQEHETTVPEPARLAA